MNDVKQVDREAYLKFNTLAAEHCQSIMDGEWDNTTGMQALASHRIAAEAAKDAEIATLQARVAELEGAARGVIDWFIDDRWGRWTYMEGSQIYSDKDRHADALSAALKEPTQ